MNDKLKPCPLCGGAAAVWYFSDAQGYGVECGTASCGMEVTGCDNEAHAIRMWNTRPGEDALSARVVELGAFQASVPWRAIYNTLTCALLGLDKIGNNLAITLDVGDLDDWRLRYAPPEGRSPDAPTPEAEA